MIKKFDEFLVEKKKDVIYDKIQSLKQVTSY